MSLNLVKKTKLDSDYKIQHFESKKPFKLIYDGDNWGTYNYNEHKGKYDGFMGTFENETILRAIRDKSYFIQVEPVNETDI